MRPFVSAPRHRLPRRLPAFVLLAAALATALATALPSGGQEPPAPPPHLEKGGARIWWNQERFVEALKLSDEQRAKMDAILEGRRDRRRELGQGYVAARRELGEAVAKGDWAAAEAARNRLGEAASELARSESGLVLEVFHLLDESQRQTAAAEFPALLQRPWLMGFGGERQGRRLRPRGARPGGS